MNTIHRSLALAGLSLVSLVSASARGADQKFFPGPTCQPDTETSKFRRANNGMFNPGNALATWQCPMVRDQVDGAKNIESATVWVIDRDDIDEELAHRVRCTLYVTNAQGDEVVFEKQSSVGSSPVPQQLNYHPLDTAANGPYLFTCTVPALKDGNASGVVSYTLIEETE